ncbi:MAG TPA: Gfo/Idh/MocA family oxidoreductase [Pirellulales bacterium]|nr:Gfo/Idh/MocA family oxidoreductase [Pirellulales bacterium]
MSNSLPPSRREFLKSSSAVAGGALAGTLAISRAAHASVDDTIKVGLIGCGGRGTEAAQQALHADKGSKLVAMGDAFDDRLQMSHRIIGEKFKDQPNKFEVPPDRCFTGFDAYKGVLGSGVDVVILTTPPHFRPLHFQAAVAAGKHIFCEKPVAVDAPGIRSVLKTAEEAKKKDLCVVSGLCWRYDLPKRAIVQKIHDGAIGDVLAMHSTYLTGLLWQRPRKPEWSEMEYQMRNWLYYTWLSGDHIVEQHIHSLDKAAWIMHDEPPASAIGVGGRQVRTGEQFGNIYDHHAVTYEYANGVKLFSYCRQMDNCEVDVNDHIIGAKGSAQLMKHTIIGSEKWQYSGPAPLMYQVEHNELFAAIRAGQRIDNSLYMVRSSLMAIMGRMATYTGQRITWDEAFNSKEDLSPARYEWGSIPAPAVAKPGKTKFV